jgi:hypothetical protein
MFWPTWPACQTEQTNNEAKASIQTHMQGNNKNNEEKQYRKITNRKVQSETTWEKKSRKKSSEAESFRHMKIKISYTPEDGHVGRNM